MPMVSPVIGMIAASCVYFALCSIAEYIEDKRIRDTKPEIEHHFYGD